MKNKDDIPTDEEYIAYIENKNMNTIDFYEYMRFCNYYPFVKIYLDEKAISEVDLNLLMPKLLEYYDEKSLNVSFERVDTKLSRTRRLVDKVKSYDMGSDKEYIPVYKWN